MRNRWGWWWVLAAMVAIASHLPAQATLGPRDDATVLPHGAARLSVTQQWLRFDERFFTAPGELVARSASSAPALAALNASTTITPFLLELGLFDRLSIGIMVPYVRARTELAFDTSRTGGEDRFGVQPESLATLMRRYVGDVEAGAKARLVDGTRQPASDAVRPGIRMRASVGALMRFGTGIPPSPDVPFDLGTGDGQTDIEASVYADILVGRRLWASAILRHGWQLPDAPVVAIPTGEERIIPPAYALQRVARDLGDYLEVEITPRYVVGDYIGVALHYSHRRRTEDRHQGTFEIDAATTGTEDITLDASTLDHGTARREHRIGAGLSYSSLSAFARGGAIIPVDVSVFHYQTVGAADQPKVSSQEVRLRVYARVLGR